MANDAVATTRLEELSKNFDAVVGEAENASTPAPAVERDTQGTEDTEAVADAPAGRTAGRKRDEQGRLLPGKPEKNAVAAPERADTAPDTESGAQTAAATAPQPKARPPRPSTWKKEYWDHWEKIDPALAEYLTQRESQFASGVSTYKAEYDRIKPMEEALKPYMPYFQQAGVKPEQAVGALMQNHNVFTYGTPEQKLQQFARLAQDYQIPLHQLLVQGEDGKVYLNQQYFQQQQAQQAAGITPQEVDRIVAQRLALAQVQAAVQQFTAAKDGGGNPLYPHFETVKETMDGLLRAGLAQDLPSAYDAALRMPKHGDLFEAQQTAKRESEQAAQARAKQEQAARARAAAVSTKSQAPTGAVTTANKGSKTRLEELSENFDSIVGASGRV